MKEKTVPILGSDYKIRFTTEKKEPKLRGCYGNCNQYEKEICVESEYRDGTQMHPAHTAMAVRHEVIHAFLSESGFRIEHDEDLVNWIAQMFPKMNDVFEQLDVTQ